MRHYLSVAATPDALGRRRRPRACAINSECQPQRYLHLTRAVGYVQNAAEGGVAESSIGIGATRPVKGVDQIATRLQEHALAEGKPFEEPEILHGLPGAAQVTEFPWRIAQGQRHTVGSGGWGGEGCSVQIRLAGPSRIIERPSRCDFQRHTGYHIGAYVAEDIE